MAKEDRTGNRRFRKNFARRTPSLGHYFIVTDTQETEKNYLYGLRDSLSQEVQGRIVISVSKAKTKELVDVCQRMSALEPQYAEPWIVFDRDQVVDFDKIIQYAEQQKINVGWSNPCIEIWFDAYFGIMHNYHDSVSCCREFAKTFEKQTGVKYKKANPKIYSLLNSHGNEKSAIQIAKIKLDLFNKENIVVPSQMCPCTTLHKLVEEIHSRVDNALTK